MELTQEQIETALQERAQRNRFAVASRIFLESVERDRAVMRHTVCEESCNPFGTVHGGLLFTMADCAAGTAIHTDGRTYVTLNSSMNFIANVQPGTTVRAIAQVRHRGRSTCQADVNVISEAGTLLCTGQFTFFCLGDRMEGTASSGR